MVSMLVASWAGAVEVEWDSLAIRTLRMMIGGACMVEVGSESTQVRADSVERNWVPSSWMFRGTIRTKPDEPPVQHVHVHDLNGECLTKSFYPMIDSGAIEGGWRRQRVWFDISEKLLADRDRLEFLVSIYDENKQWVHTFPTVVLERIAGGGDSFRCRQDEFVLSPDRLKPPVFYEPFPVKP
ncbi:MAG: hypothetical protein FJY73_06750 [Candidatus Eisenbacteria bacterium]|nr:hypothetical protein [Candidatus Eisenbacteria bacterium]